MAYREDLSLQVPVDLTKGADVANAMLLDQYSLSTNLKTYMACFTAEMDYLFEQIDRVYWGRFLNYAIGAQLDVIGRILGQSRAVVLPTSYFGFVGASPVDQMANEAVPAGGGVFLDENSQGFNVTPLNDTQYRNLLFARSKLMTSDTCDLELAYAVLSLSIGRMPSKFELAGEVTNDQLMNLTVTRDDMTATEIPMLLYVSKWLMPTGKSFTIIQL